MFKIKIECDNKVIKKDIEEKIKGVELEIEKRSILLNDFLE